MRNILIIIFLLTGYPLFSQYPLAAGSPHGVYIFLSNEIPVNEPVRVSRSSGKNSRVHLADVQAPGTEEELASRIHKYEPLFSDLGHYTDQDIRRMWDFLQKSTVIDTLPAVNYPVMHLAAGTAYLDEDAREGTRYTYSVTYHPGKGNAESRTTQPVSLPSETDLPEPQFNSMQSDHNRIYAEWKAENNPLMFSFRVFKRTNMAGEFKKAATERGFFSKNDSIYFVINDYEVAPRMVYEYYIQALDRLGNAGPPSSPVMVSSFLHSDIPVVNRFDVSHGEEDHTVKLYWKVSHQDRVRSISIYRSAVYDSAYSRIAELPPGDSTYTDRVPGAMENYYYYLVFQGTMNRSFPSARVGGHAVNLTPPDPPDEVAAVPVENGVKIYWKHLDPQVMGYYLYRDQGVSDSLTQVSGLIRASGELMAYVDTSRTLQGNMTYRYAVAAVNDGYQVGQRSSIASARPAISTTVLSPSGLHGGYTAGKILLVWDDMNQEDPYLVGYNVYRKETGQEYGQVNQNLLTFNTNVFSDTTVRAGKSYDYAVTSLDESGSESPFSTQVTVQVPVSGEGASPPSGLRATRGGEGIVLSWPAGSLEKNTKGRIYRYTPGQKPARIAEVEADTFTFTDQTADPGQLYFYYMTVVDQHDRETGAGETVSIRF